MAASVDPFEAFRQRKTKEEQEKKRLEDLKAGGLKIVSHRQSREILRQLPPKPKGFDTGRFD